MIDDAALRAWFCEEVLPHEAMLTQFIRRNWPVSADVDDLRQEVYERMVIGVRNELPRNVKYYLYAVARNHLINRAQHERVVSFELVADMTTKEDAFDHPAPEPNLIARDELRRAQVGLDNLPPRCREVVRLRKVDGLSTAETATHLGISIDTVEKQLTLGMRALVDFMLGGAGRISRPGRSHRKIGRR